MSDEDDLKKFTLATIIGLAILVPACWKIIDWINYIGLVEFSIYAIISIGSIIFYSLFKFLGKKD